MLDEITRNEIPMVPKNQKDHQKHQETQTPRSVVRIYIRLSRPPERYSPSFYYALLIDFGEPEGYGEAM